MYLVLINTLNILMKRQALKKVLTIGFCLIGSLVSLAQTKEEEHGQKGIKKGNITERFQKFDTDSNGLLSIEEIKGTKLEERIGDKWEAIDTNGDAQVSLEELKAHRAAHRGEKKGKRKKLEAQD